jgi:hypothetical protein
MFIEVTDQIKDILENPNDRVFRNEFLPIGVAGNAQFLRYKSVEGIWELEVRAGFASFKVDLQQHQASALIEGKEMFHRYKLSIISHIVRDPLEDVTES